MLFQFLILLSFLILFWHYIGYPLAVLTIDQLSPTEQTTLHLSEFPTVSVVITAYNESDTIIERIENCYDLDYPSDKLEIILASDGSTDDTVERVRTAYPGVTIVENDERNKAQTRNDGVKRATAEILVFTDAQTRFHTGYLKALVRQFSDSSVGVVGGKLISTDFETGSIGTTLRWYWQWEYALREAHSNLGLLPKLSGANMAVRRSCYVPPSKYVDVDQTAGFDALRMEYNVRYESDAVATEQFPTSPSGEMTTRRRLTTQACTTLWAYRDVINPFSNPALFGSTVSYWHLRYLVPWLLLIIGIVSMLGMGDSLLLAGTALVTLLFAFFAAIGFVLDRVGITLPPFSFAFAFLWVNAGILLGTIAFLKGHRINSYDPI